MTVNVQNAFGSETFKEQWSIALQEELDAPTIWKDICRVEYTNIKILHNPYLTDPSVACLTRGCGYGYKLLTITDDDTTIDIGIVVPQAIDRADMAQLGNYARVSELAKRQAVILNEKLETEVFAAAYAGGTDMGTETFANGSGSTQITVSATNIDDIIRAVKREVREAGGENIANRNGLFIAWRAADFEILEGFMQANGFVTSDVALRDGARRNGIDYMGVTHYSSNFLDANHVVGGVKKGVHIGILSATYGQIMVDEHDPGQLSGIGIVSRVDYKVKVWQRMTGLIFDINVV
ncbi:hypothetical protein LCGC14_2741650 [marine sediment metagenome]|uniref:Capsid protein n=1 Tax=marine sediment metagenome TaxID=412755 RepID=A0A0F8ZRG8_9ZZZZ